MFFTLCIAQMQKRGMARIQRTHHPIFQGHLDTSTFSPIDDGTAPETAPAETAPALQPSPSEEAVAQVLMGLHSGCLCHVMAIGNAYA